MLGAAIWLAGTGVAMAASDGAVTLIIENDKFTGSDNNYSNGVGISWSSGEINDRAPDSLARRWVELWDFLPRVGSESVRTWASWTLGQEMHTPDDLTDPDPPLDDQPYAGILYVDNTFHYRRKRWGNTWNVRLGVVGPASQAGDVQEWYHDLIGSNEPRGWDTQLPNEPLLNIDYTAGYILHEHEFATAWSWRLIPHAGAGIGNYFTGISLGLYGEIGWNLTETLGISTLRQGISTASAIGGGPQRGWTVSFFAGGTAFGVVHYLPLDGTVFRDSRSVESNPVVGLVTGGVALRHRRFGLTLAATYFTERFETERQRTEFGTVSLSWFF